MQGKGQQYVTSGPAAFSIELNVQTNLYVVDSSNWSNVKAGRSFRAVDSAHATHSPAVVRAPRAGTWWVVIEATGRQLRYKITPLS
jgi:uncharacterized protein DUF1883